MDQHIPAQWITTPAALDDFLRDVDAPAMVGMDTEFMRRDSYYARLALLQLRINGQTALVDPLAVAPSAALRQLMENPATVCVMHSAGEDIETLAAWLPHGPAHLFDTQIAAALAGYGSGLGYQRLVAAITGIDLPKDETRSDWLKRPLSASQRDYAAQDVVHLEAIHDTLHDKLQRLGRLEWLAEDCAKLCHRAELGTIDPQPQRALRGAAEWPRERQALLRRLLLWREQTARAVDKPRPWLIDDKLALALAEQPPASTHELAERSRGQRALRGPLRQSLFDELQRPLEQDEIAHTASIPPTPCRSDRPALDALKESVEALATELDIPTGTLCPRRLIEELLMTRHWPDGLQGWREPLLRPRLETLLPT